MGADFCTPIPPSVHPSIDPRLRSAALALDPAPLGLLQARQLQRRFDRKYVVPLGDGVGLVESLGGTHGVLLAGVRRLARYRTTYFDTQSRRAFHDHRRGRPRRAKVRTRTYVDRDLTVLEVKQRTGRGTTDKSRRVRDEVAHGLSASERRWLAQHVDWCSEVLPVAGNDFLRLTLLGIDAVERITMDVEVEFVAGERSITLEHLAIVEVKTPTRGQPSAAVDWLRQHGHRPTGFSKYCTGSVLLNRGLPDHAFRGALRLLHRLEVS